MYERTSGSSTSRRIWLIVCGASKARVTVCSPGSPAIQRVPPVPDRASKTRSMGWSGASEVTSTVATVAMSISPVVASGVAVVWLDDQLA